MVDKSWAWAASHKRLRNNPVHGEEEAKLVLEDFFGENMENGEMNHLEGTGLFEVSCKAFKTVRNYLGGPWI